MSAAHKLIDTDGVEVILGGFCSGETIPVVPIAAAAKVALLSGSASSPALTGASPFFFRDYPSDAAQGKVLAEVAFNDKKWKKVAVIQEQTDYAAGVYKAFNDSYSALGGTTMKEEFASSATDFRSTLSKLKTQAPDALFIDTQTAAASERVLKQMQELGWKPALILNDVTGAAPETLKKYAALTEGAITAEFSPDEANPKLQKMVSDFKAKFKVTEMPYPAYMSCIYDALYLLRDGIAAVGYDGQALATWSRTVKDWTGVSGPITIQDNGDRASGHSAFVVQGSKAVPIKK